VRALLLACVTGILLGAARGAATATAAQDPPGGGVPAPHLGDRGMYTLKLDGS